MKKIWCTLFSISCLSFLISGCNSDDDKPPRSVTRIVVFGDSLSDGGTYHALGLAKAGTLNGKTYSAVGRYTTNPGKVWAEYLADQYEISLKPNRYTGPGVGPNNTFGISVQGGTNYAEGGAQITESPSFSSFQTNASNQLIDSAGNPITSYTIQNNQCVPATTPASNGITAASIKDQIDRYLADNPKVPQDALVIIQGGSIDIIRQIYGISNCGATYIPIAQNNISDVAQQLVAQTNRLIAAGAQKVLVGTLPDLAQTPLGATTTTAVQTIITGMTQSLNTTLTNAFTNQSQVKIADFNQFYTQVAAAPNSYGITVTNGGTACKISTMYTTLSAYAITNPDPALRTDSALFCNEIDYESSNTPQTYAFADAIHPSSGLHQKFATQVFSMLESANWK